MEENKDLVQNTNENNTAEQNFEQEELTVTQATDSEQDNAPVDIQLEDGESPLDKNVKLMSPTRMVLRRFFRSKLSIAGLVMLIALFVFSWLGPVICPALGYDWGEIETDRTGNIEYTPYEVEGENGSFVQIIVTDNGVNALAPISPTHILGTDEQGMDILPV